MVLLYHLVFPAKYRKVVIDEHVDQVIKNICLEMEKKISNFRDRY